MHIEITKEMLEIGGIVTGIVTGITGIVVGIVSGNKAKKEVEEMRDSIDKLSYKANDELTRQTEYLNTMLHTVNRSVVELSGKTDIDISDEILRTAIDRAARDAAEAACRVAIVRVKDDMHQIVEDQVTEMVRNIEPAAQTEIRRTLQKKVNNINVYNMKQDIQREVKKEIIDGLKTEVYDKAKTEVDLITSSFANQVNQQAEFIKAMNAKMNSVS